MKAFKTLKILLFIVLIHACNLLIAQVTNPDTTRKKLQMDMMDYLRLINKKPVRIHSDSVKKKSLGPFYSPLPYPGYAMVTGYLIGLGNSLSFYTYRGEDAKISTIAADDIYSQYHQSINIINSDIWTPHENFNLQGDWRFYKFPTYTYGLGSKTTLSDADAIDYSYIRFYEVIMTKIAGNLSGGIGYNLDYHWNVTDNDVQNSDNDIADILDKYGYPTKTISSGITLNVEYDDRLNLNNPHSGTYANLQIRDNLQVFGSDNNWQSLLFDGREYINLSERTGNVLALWSYDCITLHGMPPYLDLPALGMDAYDNTGRGYVEGRFRGLDLIYGEAEFRFRITKNGFLGGVLFTNASTLPEYPNNKFERINPGNGFGIRIKMNKFSDSNLCIDYGFGTGGSRGFSFNLNEVF